MPLLFLNIFFPEFTFQGAIMKIESTFLRTITTRMDTLEELVKE